MHLLTVLRDRHRLSGSTGQWPVSFDALVEPVFPADSLLQAVGMMKSTPTAPSLFFPRTHCQGGNSLNYP